MGVDGNRRRVTTRGQMNITRHESVLHVLTQRAQRFHCKLNVTGPKAPHLAWAVDETGTIETLRILMYENEIEQQEISEINTITLPEEVLQFHR